MSSFTPDSESWVGQHLTDGDHHHVGTIEEIYYDEHSDEPIWMVVKTGRLGARRAFVPAASTTRGRVGIVTIYPKRQIEDAPRIDVVDELPEAGLRSLYSHYGLRYEGDGGPTPADRILAYLM
jgi:hypothetical protein